MSIARRFSIQYLMVIVLAVAIDFGVVQNWLRSIYDPGVMFVMLPMANLLILASPGSWRGTSRPF